MNWVALVWNSEETMHGVDFSLVYNLWLDSDN